MINEFCFVLFSVILCDIIDIDLRHTIIYVYVKISIYLIVIRSEEKYYEDKSSQNVREE